MIGPHLSILVCDWSSEGMIDHLDLTSTTVDTESELGQTQIVKFGIPETIAGNLNWRRKALKKKWNFLPLEGGSIRLFLLVKNVFKMHFRPLQVHLHL